MSKLPGGERVIVPLEKLTDYSLNPEHTTGKHKARVFKAALGLTLDDASFVQSKLLEIAITHDAISQESTDLRNGEDFPCLISC